MASVSEFGLDMNDPSTLSYYSRILIFKNDPSQVVLSFEHPSKAHQRTLQSLAHALDLEYDHNTVLRQAIISRQGLWGNALNVSEDSNTETAAWRNIEESLPNILEQSENDHVMHDHAIPETRPDNFTANSLFDLNVVDEESPGPGNNQSFDGPARNMDNFSATQTTQDQISSLLDDVSVDYSVDTVPSVSEASGICQVSSASSRDLSSHSLQDRCPSTSSAVDNNRHGSCQSIHATISDFFGGPHRSTSRVTSTSSFELGRSRVEKSGSRRSSIRSSGSSAFSCFDSRSDRSGSQVSLGSGRRGPLGKIARATMKIVTVAKACWRCKILRKGCSSETPCDTCPKDSRTSDWHTLGCKRGDIKEHMLPLLLCPENTPRNPENPGESFTPHAVNEKEALCNKVSLQARGIRDEEIMKLKSNDQGSEASLLGDFLHVAGMDLCSLDPLHGSPVMSSSRGHPASSTPTPLDDRILIVMWELLSNPSTQTLHAEWTVNEFFNFLVAAALCQVETRNRLIAQSLICLSSCLEALRIQTSGHLYDDCHQTCTTSVCNVEAIANLNEEISQYLVELSRVFFAKGNMRDIKIWWMSGFYSFCIQGIVRRALIQLVHRESANTSDHRDLAAKQYLQVAVRLFVASSRIHDPLFRDLPQCSESTCTEEEISRISECRLAQISVKQPSWKDNSIKGSGAYLKLLFQDSSQVLLTSTADAGARSLFPDFDLSFKPYSWITKFKTVFLVCDSLSMSNSDCWNEVSGALSSIMFLVNRYHSYGIDIHFANHKSLAPGDLAEGIAPGGYYDVNNIATVTEIFKRVNPGGTTLTTARLADLLSPYFKRLSTAIAHGEELKPLNLIVLADAGFKTWKDESPFSIRAKLDEIHAPISHVALQIFEVGNDSAFEGSTVLKNRPNFDHTYVSDRAVSNISYVSDEQFSGEGILKANLKAWLALLESQGNDSTFETSVS